MNKELTKKLWEKYPKIFQGRYKSLQESLIPFGFECSDGWYWLIDSLCSNLQWNTDHNNSNGKYPQIIASQVKEKFGGLCFYTEGATEVQHAVISWAESLSYKICETCGSTKDISQTEGWVYTECPDCKFKRENHIIKKPRIWWLMISPKTTWRTKKYLIKKYIINYGSRIFSSVTRTT